MDHRRLVDIKKMAVNFRKDLGYRWPVCQKIILPTDDDGFIDWCWALITSPLHQCQDACGSVQTRSDQMVSQIESMSPRKSTACTGSQSTDQQITHLTNRTSALKACNLPFYEQVPQVGPFLSNKVQNPFLLKPSQSFESVIPIRASYLSHSPTEFWKHSIADSCQFFLSFCKLFNEYTKKPANYQIRILTYIISYQ